MLLEAEATMDRDHREEPSQSGDNGRDASGRFGPGNSFGRGNPAHKRAAELRRAVLAAVGEDDLKQIFGKLVELARAGDIQAARLVIEHAIGRPVNHVILDAAETVGTPAAARIDPEAQRRFLADPSYRELLLKLEAYEFRATGPAPDGRDGDAWRG